MKHLGMKILAIAVIATLGTGALLAAPANPRILERGWKLHRFPECGYQGPVPTGQDQRGRWGIADAECSPGGAWGQYLYLAVQEPDPGTARGPWPRIERVDMEGNSEFFPALTGFALSHFSPTHLAFADPGWPGGSLLFLTSRPAAFGPVQDVLLGIDPQLATQLFLSRFESNSHKGRLGSAVADGSGDLGFDMFYQAEPDPPPGSSLLGGIIRRDLSGQETEFAEESLFPATVYEEMRISPGGHWGTGIYVAGLSLAPDGTPSTFPVDFTEFDWAEGPGLDGDMFARIRGEDPGIVYRIRADGTVTRFARGLPGHIAGCGGYLWIVSQNGCFAAELKRRGPRQRAPLPLRSAGGSR